MCVYKHPRMTPKYHIYFTQIKQHLFIIILYSKKTIGQTFILKVIDISHDPMPSTYNLPNDPTKTIRLHKILFKNMLIELCA